MTNSVSELLKDLPDGSIFAKMSPQERERILELAIPKSLPRGATLYEHGELGSSFAIIAKGLLKVCVFSLDGKEIVFDYLGRGNIIGEISIFDGKPRTASAIAVEPTEVLVMQKKDVLPYLARHGETSLKIIELLCERLRKTDMLMEQNTSLAMEPKLAKGILRFAQDHGKKSADGTIDIQIRQSDLGSYVSLARENVNRQLREWADLGFVELTRGHIVIKDQRAIEEIAEEAF